MKPAGSFVDVMKDASSARESPAAKCVLPFCVGIPTRSTCERWYGKNTKRPRYNASALDAEMTTFTSSNARAVTRAPRVAVRVCFATRLHHRTHAHTRSSVPRLFQRASRPTIDRSIDRSIAPSIIHRPRARAPRIDAFDVAIARAPLQRRRRATGGNGRAREHRSRRSRPRTAARISRAGGRIRSARIARGDDS